MYDVEYLKLREDLLAKLLVCLGIPRDILEQTTSTFSNHQLQQYYYRAAKGDIVFQDGEMSNG